MEPLVAPRSVSLSPSCTQLSSMVAELRLAQIQLRGQGSRSTSPTAHRLPDPGPIESTEPPTQLQPAQLVAATEGLERAAKQLLDCGLLAEAGEMERLWWQLSAMAKEGSVSAEQLAAVELKLVRMAKQMDGPPAEQIAGEVRAVARQLGELLEQTEGRLAEQIHKAGLGEPQLRLVLSSLRQVLAALSRGELGLRIQIWRDSKREAKQAARDAANALELLAKDSRSGLRMLQHTMVAVAKGELALRVRIWRSGALQAKDAAATAELKRMGTTAGLRMVQQVMAEATRGELGMRLQIWRAQKQQSSQADTVAEQHRMAYELKRLSTTAGLTMLKQATARLIRGELGLRIQIWRQSRQQARQAASDAAKAMQLFVKDSRSGLRMLQHTMVAVAKGELALRVRIWRSGALQAKDAAATAELKRMGTTAGLRMVQQVMAEATRGELGMRLQIWRAQKQQSKDWGQQAAVSAVLSQLKRSEMAAGLGMLKQVLAVATRGQLGMRIQIWRDRKRYAKQAAGDAAIAAAVRSTQFSVGLRLLKQVLAEATRGELGLRLQIWKDNLRKEWRELLQEEDATRQEIMNESLADAATERAISVELRALVEEVRQELLDECHKTATLEVKLKAATAELVQVQRKAADQIALMEQTAGMQIHDAEEELEEVKRIAAQERAQLEAVCDELRSGRHDLLKALEGEATQAARERAQRPGLNQVAKIQRESRQEQMLRDSEVAKYRDQVKHLKEAQRRLEQELASYNRQDRLNKQQVLSLQSQLGERAEIPPQVLSRISSEIQQLQLRDADAQADTNQAWHMAAPSRDLPEFAQLSEQLAVQNELRESWAKLCRESFVLVGGRLEVPIRSPPKLGVELLRRTMHLLESAESSSKTTSTKAKSGLSLKGISQETQDAIKAGLVRTQIESKLSPEAIRRMRDVMEGHF